jgi:hypothetical protein
MMNEDDYSDSDVSLGIVIGNKLYRDTGKLAVNHYNSYLFYEDQLCYCYKVEDDNVYLLPYKLHEYCMVTRLGKFCNEERTKRTITTTKEKTRRAKIYNI